MNSTNLRLEQYPTVLYNANLNPLGIPESVRRAIAENLSSITKYPDIYYNKLKKAAAEYTDMTLDRIVMGNGSSDLYKLYTTILKPKKALLLSPGPMEYERVLRTYGCEAKYFDLSENKDFELDMNELFPGVRGGAANEYVARCVVDDIKGNKEEKGADFCLDIHGSDLYLHEIPQIRMDAENVEELMPYACSLNTDMVWIHPSHQVQSGSLCYELNKRGIKCVITESSYAFNIDQAYSLQIVDGIFALMKWMGIWQGETVEPKKPLVARDDRIAYLNSETSGIFVPQVKVHEEVLTGEKIGEVVNVITGSVEQVIVSPVRGMISAIRQYPVIEVGSLLCRIVEN